MKKFKEIDVWVSLALIIGSLFLPLFGGDFSFMYGYFIVGGWQVISMLVHILNPEWKSFPNNSRNVYYWITIISLASMPIGGYIILLFTSPFMALFYTYMCYDETYVKMKRPLDILK
jgi:hypothetical protein